jgi:hypothetical protein
MTFDYVRRTYGVPARRGMQIQVDGRPARILSATHTLHVLFLDSGHTGWAHPTWRVLYPESNGLPNGSADISLARNKCQLLTVPTAQPFDHGETSAETDSAKPAVRSVGESASGARRMTSSAARI